MAHNDWRVSDGDWHEPPEWNYRGRQVDAQGVAVNAPRPTLRVEGGGGRGQLARAIREAGEARGRVKVPVQHMKQMSVRAALEAARGACPLKGRGRGEWIMREALVRMGYSARVRWLQEQGRRRG